MITIETVESLATQLEQEGAAARGKLLRLIRAEARIVAQRDPSQFNRVATECGDEAGHSDNSYPPKVEYRNRTGPRLLQVSDNRTTDVPTSSGFYYSWRRVTEDEGLFVSRDGRIYGCHETGTGRLGQFAAHPGDCDVEVTLEWSPRNEDDLTLEELHEIESHLRSLAFPLSVAEAS